MPCASNTNFPNHFVILQNPPSDVHAVIFPVRLGHMLIDICIHPCHVANYCVSVDLASGMKYVETREPKACNMCEVGGATEVDVVE